MLGFNKKIMNRQSVPFFACTVLSVFLLVSCQQKNCITEPLTGKAVEVTFSVPEISSGILPAPWNGCKIANGSTTLECVYEPALTKASENISQGTGVRVIAYKNAANNPHASNYIGEQTYTVSSSGTLQPTGGNTLLLIPGRYDFYTVTPALSLTGNTTVSVGNKVDYATSVTQNKQISYAGSAQNVPLTTLTRQCAKVTFVVKGADDFSTLTNLSITSLVVNNLPADISSAAGNTLSPAAGGSGSITLTTFTGSGTQVSATTVILPKTSGTVNLNYTLSYSISGTSTGSKTIAGTITTAFANGGNYTVTLTLNKPKEYPDINGWIITNSDAGGNSGITIHPAYSGTAGYYQEIFTGSSVSYPESKNASTVSAKYQIGSQDVSSSTYTWANAVSQCQAYREGGYTNWRLPTQRELVQMFELKRDGKITNNFVADLYWAGSEYDGSHAWVVSLGVGSAGCNRKGNYFSVRCVRDM